MGHHMKFWYLLHLCIFYANAISTNISCDGPYVNLKTSVVCSDEIG